jgi:DHA1 family bicyclomycin/chloramphenicol resistance-like MFS transporter
MAPFSKEAGSASALLGAIQMGLGAVASAAVGWLFNGTALPMTGVMAGCAITSFLILTFGRRQIAYKAAQQEVQEQAFDLIERY